MHNANFSTVRAFLFDLDGTLIDSKLDLVNSVNFMLREMQREVLPLATIASYIGHGAPRLVADALGPDAAEADRKRGLEIFLAHYGEHNLDATHAYPGVIEGLEALQDRPMAVLTNKPKKMSVEILGERDIAQLRRAGAAAKATLGYVAERIAPGVTTSEIDAWVRAHTRDQGGRPSQLGH